jgi:geranylgeranyl pyrophosphate synthase
MKAALAPAAAIELVHCFSLVHDDLPAMDDDDLRRGRPTLHRHTNEAMAILAGDAMSSLAFELIVTRIADPVLACSLVRELSIATNDMIAGQVYDTLPDFAPGTSDMTKLTTIHHHKTGALLRCSCRMGALVGKASPDRLAAMTAYGKAVGLMFQVVDDLLDVTQTTEHLGKTAKKDEAQGKMTYPSVMGVDKTRAEVARLHAEALAALEPLGAPAQPLRDLCHYMATRSR